MHKFTRLFSCLIHGEIFEILQNLSNSGNYPRLVNLFSCAGQVMHDIQYNNYYTLYGLISIGQSTKFKEACQGNFER